MFSYLDIIYEEPIFDSVGHVFPDHQGHVYSRLNGKVRSASSFHYTVRNGEYSFSKECYSTLYDQSGQLRHRETTDKEGNLKETDIYVYDNNGRCVEFLTLTNKGEFKSHNIFTYNEKGLLYTGESLDEEGSRGKKVYLYDDNGFVIEERWDSRSHENSWKCLYKNNNQGEWIEMKEYKGEYGTTGYWFARKNTKIYDDFGHVKEHLYVDSNGKEKRLNIDEYDEKGRCVKMSDWKLLFSYDSNDKLIGGNNPDDGDGFKVLYNYDGSISILWSDKDNKITKRREIQFDRYKNIKSIIDYKGENLDLIEVSTFCYEYYPLSQ